MGDEILQEIDDTLDRLILNATALQETAIEELSIEEKEAFEKTQESLLAHLLHMDEALVERRKELKKPSKSRTKYQIQEKLFAFKKLDQRSSQVMAIKIGVSRSSRARGQKNIKVLSQR